MPACRLHRRKGADGGFRSITQNSRSPLRRDPSSSAGAAGRLCVAGGRGRMCAVAPCALCGMARPHVPLEPADGKLCGAEGLRRGLPGGAYASRTGDVNAAVPCPMAVGVLRPVVLVPETLCESLLLEWMLRHELTHIKRGHIVCKAVLLSACAVHWYNPAVWLLARRCEKDRNSPVMKPCCTEQSWEHLSGRLMVKLCWPL